MRVNWGKPTLQYALDGDTAYANKSNIFEMPEANGVSLSFSSPLCLHQHLTNLFITVVLLVDSNFQRHRLPHPIHLHSHDFYIVGRGDDVWDGTTTGLTFTNPTRCDVATTSLLYLLAAT